MNDNCYYDNSIDEIGNFQQMSITKILLEIINEKYFILSKKIFNKR
jgi:hypothetical protein